MDKKQKKRTIYFFFLLILSEITVFSTGHAHLPMGAKALSMAGTSVAVIDFWSVYNNAALMPFHSPKGIGLHYDNRFLLKETSCIGIGAQCSLDESSALGLYAKHYGYRNYTEWNVGLAYAKAFAEVFSFGLQCDYLFHAFGDKHYGSRHGFTFEMGMYGKINKELSLGFHIYNPARLKMGGKNQAAYTLPLIFRFGFCYSFTHCLLSCEMEKDWDTPSLFRMGISYEANKTFYIRGGLSLPTFSVSVGVGLVYNHLILDVASSYHGILGYSPQLSIMYTFGREKNKDI